MHSYDMPSTLEELLRASAYVLGKTGDGIVYKAVLDEGTVVAVRRLGVPGGEQRHKDFEAEVKAIAQVRHPNIVCLHSYSWTVSEKLLIYEYLSNGSLETALHGKHVTDVIFTTSTFCIKSQDLSGLCWCFQVAERGRL
jgi:hypothetical protein